MQSNQQQAQLTIARRLLATLGYKIFTTARRHYRGEDSFVATKMNSSVRTVYLLCPRRDGLEIRFYTKTFLNKPILDTLRKELSIPLRVGRILPHNTSLDVIRFIVPAQHEEYTMLLKGARL